MTARLFVKPDGWIVGLYSDEIDYGELGEVETHRAADVEPQGGRWWRIDFRDEAHTVAVGFQKRDAALKFETDALERDLRSDCSMISK